MAQYRNSINISAGTSRRQSGEGEGTGLLRTSVDQMHSNSLTKSGSRPNHASSSLDDGMETIDLGEVALLTSSGTEPKKPQQFVIMPQSQFRRTWVQVTFVVALYIIWVTPIRVGFDMQAQGPWFWIEGVIDLFFYTDLVLNFFTAFEHPATGEIITDRKRIIQRYLTGWFWIDLLATFPSDYIVKALEGTMSCSWHNDCSTIIKTDTALSVIVLLRTTRIFRIIWIFKNFNVLSVGTMLGRLQDEFVIMRWLLSIMELLVVLIFLGHLCGCFFYMFSHPKWQTPEEQLLIGEGELSTWVLDKLGAYDVLEVPTPFQNTTNTMATDLVRQDPTTGVWYECPQYFRVQSCPNCQGPKLRCKSDFGFAYRYITSMYWAYTTMTTVGYGDIVGTTIAEKVWCIITMVIGGFFLSFCFGRIASVVSRLDADRQARAEEMENVTQFLKDTDLPKALSRRVLDFFKTNMRSIKPYDRAAVLAKLPFDLRSKTLQHLYLPTIKSVPLLRNMADDDVFITDLTIRMQPYHTSSETFVYQKGELSADLFILLRGDLHLMDGDKRHQLCKIPEGTIFGESTAISHAEGEDKARRAENVFCKTPCDMLRLDASDMTELCERYPQLLKALKHLDRARQQRLATIVSVPAELATLGAAADGGHGKAGPHDALEPVLPELDHIPGSVLAASGAAGALPGKAAPRVHQGLEASATIESLSAEVQQLRRALQDQRDLFAAELRKQQALIQQLPALVAAQMRQ